MPPSFLPRSLKLDQPGRMLGWGMVVVFAVHVVQAAVPGMRSVDLSRWLTGTMAALAGGCALHRGWKLPWRERLPWMWSGVSMLLWGCGCVTESLVGRSTQASTLTIDAADFIYLGAVLPLMLVLSNTRETQSIRTMFLLNCGQLGLALVLAYFLLYRMAMTPEAASVVSAEIYGVACVVLAGMSLVRALSWSTQEERQCVRWISIFLWVYLPVELGMDFATRMYDLRGGGWPDLAWSLPFGLAGWKALTMTAEPTMVDEQPTTLPGLRLLVDAVCPMLMNCAIFVLAAGVIRQHLVLGLTAMFLLMTMQGLQASVLQMNLQGKRKLLLARERDLRVANAELEALTLLDPLTGIANRRRFDSAVEAAWRRCSRWQQPLAVLMVDVDYFKGVNDHHGHSYGDECLVKIARVMDALAHRPDDLVARLGGEEFVILLPDTLEHGATAIAERLHSDLERVAIRNASSPFNQRLTVSIGMAMTVPEAGESPADLLKAADEALYTAKQQGRNRSCWGKVVRRTADSAVG